MQVPGAEADGSGRGGGGAAAGAARRAVPFTGTCANTYLPESWTWTLVHVRTHRKIKVGRAPMRSLDTCAGMRCILKRMFFSSCSFGTTDSPA